MSNTAFPHPIWAAVLAPSRSVEVLAWLKKKENRQLALTLRGHQGETMLHWAALADDSLTLELIGVGIDIQSVDDSGRTPIDWVFERMWMTHMEGVGHLTALNLRKLRLQTDDQAMILWRQGARRGVQDFDERHLAAHCGLWKFLQTLADLDGLPLAWSNLEGGNTVLHSMAGSPNESGRDQLLALWKEKDLPLDGVNAAGQTALLLAVEHRLALVDGQAIAIGAANDWICALVKAGADPNHSSPGLPSPAALPLLSGASPALCDVIEGLLGSESTAEEGNLPLG